MEGCLRGNERLGKGRYRYLAASPLLSLLSASRTDFTDLPLQDIVKRHTTFTMKSSITLALLQALAVQAVRIVQSNDDGWAELYIRSFNDALNQAGHQVVLSGPAENQSGRSK